MNVEWRTVEGWPNYQVSSDGQVRSFSIRGGNKVHPLKKPDVPRLRSLTLGQSGYYKVIFYSSYLSEKQITKTFLVNRLVAMAFLGKGNEGEQVAHLDGNRKNNKVENLKWCSAKENSSHKFIHGTMPIGSKNSNALLKECDVLEIRELCKKGEIPQVQLAKRFGVNPRTISAINKNISWKHVS